LEGPDSEIRLFPEDAVYAPVAQVESQGEQARLQVHYLAAPISTAQRPHGVKPSPNATDWT
jgi:hypothetical protein